MSELQDISDELTNKYALICPACGSIFADSGGHQWDIFTTPCPKCGKELYELCRDFLSDLIAEVIIDNRMERG